MLSQLIFAARSLARDYAAHTAARNFKLQQARNLADAGDPASACALLRGLRQQSPKDATILAQLAQALVASGNAKEAAVLSLEALRVDPDAPTLHHLFGSLMRQGGDQSCVSDYAAIAFQLDTPATLAAIVPLLAERVDAAPAAVQPLLQLGHGLVACDQLAAATVVYQRAHACEGNSVRMLHVLAAVYQLQAMTTLAARCRGLAHYQLHAWAEAVSELDAIALASDDTATIEALAWALVKTGNHQRAVEVCAAACGRRPSAAVLYHPWLWALRQLDATEQALGVAAAAANQVDPLFLLQQRLLLLPPVFRSTSQLHRVYQRFLHGLMEFELLTVPLEGETARALLATLSPNFELAYLGCDVTAPLRRFGAVMQRLAATAYPHWSVPRLPDAAAYQRRLRIGYVSAHLHIHSACMLAYGWLVSHTREQFEVHVYHVGDRHDVLTGKLAQECEHFTHVGGRLETACSQILHDRLDILVYLDIGMEMLTTVMASLRLAPLQCATWAHPITTGLPCVDVFVSNMLMEPAVSASHYSEQLLRLPGIGACLPTPWLPPLTGTRQQFDLADDAILYVSMQLIGKYLPQYDDVFATIATQVPQACFLLLEADSPELTAVLRHRLDCAFTAAGLDAARYLRWMPRMDYDRYLQLLQLADIFLDPPGAWSAGITAIEAVACALPLVTLPGDFLRSRQACGILTAVGITAGIASDRDDYVAIAARLGNDSAFNAQVRDELRRKQATLFNNTEGVRALEAFFLDRCR